MGKWLRRLVEEIEGAGRRSALVPHIWVEIAAPTEGARLMARPSGSPNLRNGVLGVVGDRLRRDRALIRRIEAAHCPVVAFRHGLFEFVARPGVDDQPPCNFQPS